MAKTETKEKTKKEIKTDFAPHSNFIIRPYISEKAQRLLEENQYVFHVETNANKILIKREIERMYGVKVLRVSVTTIKSKSKTFRGKTSTFKNKKKATVKIAKGQKIDLV